MDEQGEKVARQGKGKGKGGRGKKGTSECIT